MKSLTQLALALCLTLGLAATGLAQDPACSTLTVGGSLTAPGDISLSVSGAPAEAMTVFCVADMPGTTDLGPVVLGLATPIIPIFVTQSDANGDAGFAANLPALPPSIVPADVSFQAVSVDFSLPDPTAGPGMPTFSFCTSNVVSVTVTAAP